MTSRKNIFWTDIASAKEIQLDIMYKIAATDRINMSTITHCGSGSCNDLFQFRLLYMGITRSLENTQQHIDNGTYHSDQVNLIISIQGTVQEKEVDLFFTNVEEFNEFLLENVLVLTPEAEQFKLRMEEINARVERLESATPLMETVRSNDLEKTIDLLNNPATDINKTDSQGNTALHLAAEFGLTSIVSALLDKGANPNLKNAKGNTPLLIAVINQHTQAAKCLAYNDHIDLKIKNNDGHTAAWYAESSGHPDLQKLAARLTELEPAPAPQKVSLFAKRLEAIHFQGSLNSEFYCPISKKLMETPVTLSTGQTYDLDSLKVFFHNQANPLYLPCPVSGKLIYFANLSNVKPNMVMKNLIDETIKMYEMKIEVNHIRKNSY